jgi:hypothetical protein
MTFRKKIASFFGSKKVNVFVLFLVLALLFSVLTKLSKDYTQTIAFSIEAINVPENQILVKDSTHIIHITLTTYGFGLMKYYFSKPSIEVDFENLDKNSTHYFWSEKRELPNVIAQFDPNIKIKSINPDTIVFRYDVSNIKKVPVVLDSEIIFSSGFDLLGDYKLEPDSIRVIGPKVLTDSINKIVTKHLKLDDINSNILASVQLKFPEDIQEIKFSHDQVIVSAEVEKFTEGSIDVPVNIINIPDDIKIKFYPKTVSVLYYTSLSNFKTISSSSFIIECDYNALNDLDTHLIPEIVQQPERVKNVRLNEKRIEFILLQ